MRRGLSLHLCPAITAQHLANGRSMRQRSQFLGRLRLELAAVIDDRRTRPRVRPVSEPTVAQPLKQARSDREDGEPPPRASDLATSLAFSVVETFSETARPFAGTPECEQEQEHGEDDGAVAQRRPHPRAGGEPG